MSKTLTLKYDEVTCITAKELRDSGLKVPKDVPDCAWVPRYAMKLELAPNSIKCNDQEMTATIQVAFTEPFKWVKRDHSQWMKTLALKYSRNNHVNM